MASINVRAADAVEMRSSAPLLSRSPGVVMCGFAEVLHSLVFDPASNPVRPGRHKVLKKVRLLVRGGGPSVGTGLSFCITGCEDVVHLMQPVSRFRIACHLTESPLHDPVCFSPLHRSAYLTYALLTAVIQYKLRKRGGVPKHSPVVVNELTQP